jgi:hypothetical protein
MLEYVFFHRVPYERFLAFAAEQGLEVTRREADDCFEVGLDETLEPALAERVEACYDELLDLNQTLFEQQLAEDGDDYTAAGVVVNLANGETAYADIDPDLLGKVMSVLTPTEFGDLVDAIVAAVENPDSRGLCQRDRDGGWA